MKLVAIWGSALVLVAAAFASCSVSHRSGDFTCERSADCSDGRACVEGSCVYGSGNGSGGIDAGQIPKDGGTASCPSQCTSCDSASHTCVIDCALNGAVCAQKLSCPAGWGCDVRCTGEKSCSNLSCGDATSCRVTCTGNASCDRVTCGAGPCDVQCIGLESCFTVSCGASCACDVDCLLSNQCLADCTSARCENGSSCTSKPSGCNTCP